MSAALEESIAELLR
jgi:hypothetical protein